MWLFVIMSLLCAGVVLKIIAPVLDKGRAAHGTGVTVADKRLAIGLLWGIPLVALSVYLVLGRPNAPSSFSLFHDVPEMLARQDALLAEEPLRILLKGHPNDLSALLKLAGINTRLGRHSEAVKFYKRAVLVAAGQGDMLLPNYMERLGRAQVKANQGTVDAQATETFHAILKLQADNPIALYYLALTKAQKGDAQGAIDDWTKMLTTGTPLAYWKWDVRAAIAAARAGLAKTNNPAK